MIKKNLTRAQCQSLDWSTSAGRPNTNKYFLSVCVCFFFSPFLLYYLSSLFSIPHTLLFYFTTHFLGFSPYYLFFSSVSTPPFLFPSLPYTLSSFPLPLRLTLLFVYNHINRSKYPSVYFSYTSSVVIHMCYHQYLFDIQPKPYVYTTRMSIHSLHNLSFLPSCLSQPLFFRPTIN